MTLFFLLIVACIVVSIAKHEPTQPTQPKRRAQPHKLLKKVWTKPAGTYYTLFKKAINEPHLLIAGATGSGKSVLINGIISTILYCFPMDCENGAQLILIDPKRVELAAYAKLPHTLAHAAGFNPSAWLDALNKAVCIMDARYNDMERRHLKTYDKGDLYVVIDEWANVYKNGGKEAYKAVLRLTSEGRAAKVHLIMATQIPKANIIPTEIRENFSARFCLRTANAVQSRVIMDESGCENLPRYGQGFYLTPEGTTLYNIPYVNQEEIDRLINHWMMQK